jgi:hypothetical protein
MVVGGPTWFVVSAGPPNPAAIPGIAKGAPQAPLTAHFHCGRMMSGNGEKKSPTSQTLDDV